MADDGRSVLVITVSTGLGGLYQSAILAKSMVTEADIEVVYSVSVSVGAGLLILAAARAIEAGRAKDEVVALVKDIRERTYVDATVPSLKYLRPSGSVGRTQEMFASLLDVKPILPIGENVAEPVDDVRWRRSSTERVLELMAEAVG